MSGLDALTTLARPDLASAALEGIVAAERYAAAQPMACKIASTGVRRAPARGAELLDQILFGEVFDVLEVTDGWAWGQARRDGYVGFVRLETLSDKVHQPTHWVSALRAYGFSRPDMKTRPQGLYSMNALVAVIGGEGSFLHAAGAGWFAATQLTPLGQTQDDPADVAERFLGAPYLWGGRESLGLDCSGLVQQALFACGGACPRDADMQAAHVGRSLSGEALRRGDLVFWPGHVAMMLDAERLIHANAHHMAVAVEPLAVAVQRIESEGLGRPTALRRP